MCACVRVVSIINYKHIYYRLMWADSMPKEELQVEIEPDLPPVEKKKKQKQKRASLGNPELGEFEFVPSRFVCSELVYIHIMSLFDVSFTQKKNRYYTPYPILHCWWFIIFLSHFSYFHLLKRRSTCWRRAIMYQRAGVRKATCRGRRRCGFKMMTGVGVEAVVGTRLACAECEAACLDWHASSCEQSTLRFTIQYNNAMHKQRFGGVEVSPARVHFFNCVLCTALVQTGTGRHKSVQREINSHAVFSALRSGSRSSSTLLMYYVYLLS